MPKSTTPRPGKPWEDFPLFAHINGQWCKKIRGQHRFFGVWSDPQSALTRFLEQRDDLYAGREPCPHAGEATVRDLLNAFRLSKKLLWESGDLAEVTYLEYVATCDLLAAEIRLDRPIADLRRTDFELLRVSMARRWGPTRLGNEIQRVRTAFKYAADAKLIDRPVDFGPTFRRPAKRVQRLVKAARGDRTIQPAELLELIAGANRRLKPMILLGVNCGFGPGDCVSLPISVVDLKAGWIDYARAKTGIQRRCPLWPETIAAIVAYLKKRPEGESQILFLGRNGNADQDHRNVTHQFGRLARKLKITKSFYDLRRTFQTIGEEAGEAATRAIMGHASEWSDMSAIYRQHVTDKRLRAVVDHVHEWLFVDKPPVAG